jgi:hypothetical protein
VRAFSFALSGKTTKEPKRFVTSVLRRIFVFLKYRSYFSKTSCPMLLLILLVSACSSIQPYEIALDQDAYVTEGDGEPRMVNKGEKFTLSAEYSALIEAPGYTAVLVPPARSLPNEMKISLKPLTGWGNELVSQQVDGQLSELFTAINEVQALISRSEASKAMTRINLLEKKYPRLASLRFLKVSSLLLLKRQGEAKLALEAAVKDFPESEAGKRLNRLFGQGEGFRMPASEMCPRSP